MPAPDHAGLEARAARLRQLSDGLGFDLIGVTGPEAGPAHGRFVEAMGRGYAADMDWIAAAAGQRRDAREVLAACRSVIVGALAYWTDTPGYLEQPPADDEGWIARFAQGRDFHLDMTQKLHMLARQMRDDPAFDWPVDEPHALFCDTGPVMEKVYAQQAGLGWQGKNTLILRRDGGSWYVLGVLLVPVDIARDTPATDHCGSCTRCMDACPTGAFPEPYVLDARRCITLWTVESRDPERWLDPDTIGGSVFGCDICQEVCPWNREPALATLATLEPEPANVRPKLDDLAGLGGVEFFERFRGSAVWRTDARRLGLVVEAVREGRARAAEADADDGQGPKSV